MNKRIILTGGTSGIGYAIYKVLAEQGNKLVIFSRTSSGKSELFNERTLPLDVDISDFDQIMRAGKKARDFLGGIDILINNAGISFPGRFSETSKEKIVKSISVNLLGHILMTHAFLPDLLKQKGSFLINITSAAAQTGIPGLSVYSAAKHGIKGFTDSLRKETAEQGLRVIEISPGGVATPIHNTLIKIKGKHSVNMEYALKPEDVAKAVLYAINQPENVSINEIQLRHASLKMVGTYL